MGTETRTADHTAARLSPLAARRIAQRIISHFGDPHPAVLVEANRHGIDYVRLSRGQLDPQARIGELHRLLRLSGSERLGKLGRRGK